jgi:hypothetical protein
METPPQSGRCARSGSLRLARLPVQVFRLAPGTARTRQAGAVQHHEDTLAAYVRLVRHRPETLGVVLVGSACRGTERPDSVIDVIPHDQSLSRFIRDNELAWLNRTLPPEAM